MLIDSPIGPLEAEVVGCELVVKTPFGQMERIPLAAPQAAEKSEAFRNVDAIAGREVALAVSAAAVTGDDGPCLAAVAGRGFPDGALDKFVQAMEKEYVEKETARVRYLGDASRAALAEVGKAGGKRAVIVAMDMALGKHCMTPSGMERAFGVPAAMVTAAVDLMAAEFGREKPDYEDNDADFVSTIRRRHGDDIADRLVALVRYVPSFTDTEGRMSMEAREAIAADAGVAPSTVGHWVCRVRRETGFAAHKTGRRIQTEEMTGFRSRMASAMGDHFDEFLSYAMYSDKSGTTLVDLADKAGISPSTLRGWVGKYRTLFGMNVDVTGKTTMAGLITPAAELVPFVKDAIVEAGGSIRGRDLLDAIEAKFPLTATDLDTLPSNASEKRFHKTAYAVMRKLVADGFVTGRGDRGEGWTLTERLASSEAA